MEPIALYLGCLTGHLQFVRISANYLIMLIEPLIIIMRFFTLNFAIFVQTNCKLLLGVG